MIRKLCLVVITPLAAWAQQTSPAVLQLSLKRAVEIALAPDGNNRVQLAAESIRIAEGRSAEARAAFLPTVDGTASYRNFTQNLAAFGISSQSFGLPGVILPIPTIVGPINVYDIRLSGSLNLFDFSSIRRYQAERAAVQAAKADAQGTKDQVADQVARAYMTVIRAEAGLEAAQTNVKLSEELLRLAQNQKTAGTGTGIEVVRAQSQLANDRQALEIARNDVDRDRLNLLRLMGVRLDGTVELSDRMTYTPIEVVSPEQGWKTAQDNRADLKAQQERENSARLSYSATKWESAPSIGASGDYGTIGAQTDHLLPTHTAQIALRVPIFDGGRRQARRAESLAEYHQEQIRARDLRQQAELEIRQALDAIRSAQAEVAAAEEGLKLADQELAQARRRYQAGVTTSVEVTDAQARLERARQNQVNALFNYNIARVDLSSATGTIQEFVNR
jgi:outer membrane protein TolC